MTTREIINKLLDRPMDQEVLLCYEKEFIDENGVKCSGYNFHIDDIEGNQIMFTDWRDFVKVNEKNNN